MINLYGSAQWNFIIISEDRDGRIFALYIRVYISEFSQIMSAGDKTGFNSLVLLIGLPLRSYAKELENQGQAFGIEVNATNVNKMSFSVRTCDHAS
jgi:hypothetical protein